MYLKKKFGDATGMTQKNNQDAIWKELFPRDAIYSMHPLVVKDTIETRKRYKSSKWVEIGYKPTVG